MEANVLAKQDSFMNCNDSTLYTCTSYLCLIKIRTTFYVVQAFVSCSKRSANLALVQCFQVPHAQLFDTRCYKQLPPMIRKHPLHDMIFHSSRCK